MNRNVVCLLMLAALAASSAQTSPGSTATPCGTFATDPVGASLTALFDPSGDCLALDADGDAQITGSDVTAAVLIQQSALQFVEFNAVGLTQYDQVGPSGVEVDVQQTCCATDGASCTRVEPFTETIANAAFRNVQGDDITLERYTVAIQHPGRRQAFNVTNGLAFGAVSGKRCTGTTTLACTTDADCVGSGSCPSSEGDVQVLLFGFDAKGGVLQTLDSEVRFRGVVIFFGHDMSGQEWRARGYTSARFAAFDSCG